MFEICTAAASRISYTICPLFSCFLRKTMFNISSSLRTDTKKYFYRYQQYISASWQFLVSTSLFCSPPSQKKRRKKEIHLVITFLVVGIFKINILLYFSYSRYSVSFSQNTVMCLSLKKDIILQHLVKCFIFQCCQCSHKSPYKKWSIAQDQWSPVHYNVVTRHKQVPITYI